MAKLKKDEKHVKKLIAVFKRITEELIKEIENDKDEISQLMAYSRMVSIITLTNELNEIMKINIVAGVHLSNKDKDELCEIGKTYVNDSTHPFFLDEDNEDDEEIPPRLKDIIDFLRKHS